MRKTLSTTIWLRQSESPPLVPRMVASIPTWTVLAFRGFVLTDEKRLMWILRLLFKLLKPSIPLLKVWQTDHTGACLILRQ